VSTHTAAGSRRKLRRDRAGLPAEASSAEIPGYDPKKAFRWVSAPVTWTMSDTEECGAIAKFIAKSGERRVFEGNELPYVPVTC